MLGLSLAGAFAGGAASAGITFFVPLSQGLGFRADKDRSDPVREIAGLLVVGAGGFLLMAISGEAGVAAGAVLGLGVGWGWGGLYVLAAMRQHPAAPGAAVGVAMRGLYAGAVIGPLVGGPLAAASPSGFWSVCAGLAIVSAAIFARQRRAPAPA